MNVYNLINRNKQIFQKAILSFDTGIIDEIKRSKFLVVGGAGTIGQATVKEIYSRGPLLIDVIDINENNLVELIRDIRSSYGSSGSNIRALPLDVGSKQFDAFLRDKNINYDYILNLSALKHVRSEKDPYTLMRMIEVNIFNSLKLANHAEFIGAKKFFSVSTDKAANPINLMGASKLLMEKFLWARFDNLKISMARFANVAFSDGSLLHSFLQRFEKKQPIVVPNDVRRYFISSKEAGELCLLSTILGDNGDIFFPSQDDELELIDFANIAIKYLDYKGYKAVLFNTENEAREDIDNLINNGKWPVLITNSDTTGEKPFEEFFTSDENITLSQIPGIGIIKTKVSDNIGDNLNNFESEYLNIINSLNPWDKQAIVRMFKNALPNINYIDIGKYLDQKM